MAVLLCLFLYNSPKLGNLPQISTKLQPLFCTCMHYTKLANTSARSVNFPHLCAFLVLCIHGVVSNRTRSLKTATGVRCIRHTRSTFFVACSAARHTRGSFCQIYRRCFLNNSALLPEPLLHPPACQGWFSNAMITALSKCGTAKGSKQSCQGLCVGLARAVYYTVYDRILAEGGI